MPRSARADAGVESGSNKHENGDPGDRLRVEANGLRLPKPTEGEVQRNTLREAVNDDTKVVGWIAQFAPKSGQLDRKDLNAIQSMLSNHDRQADKGPSRDPELMSIIKGAVNQLEDGRGLPKDLVQISRFQLPYTRAAKDAVDKANATGEPASLMGVVDIKPDTKLQDAVKSFEKARHQLPTVQAIEITNDVVAKYADSLSTRGRNDFASMWDKTSPIQPDIQALDELVNKGYLKQNDDGLELTPKGVRDLRDVHFEDDLRIGEKPYFKIPQDGTAWTEKLAEFRSAKEDGSIDFRPRANWEGELAASKTFEIIQGTPPGSSILETQQSMDKLKDLKLSEGEHSWATDFAKRGASRGLSLSILLAGAAVLIQSRRSTAGGVEMEPTFDQHL
jgi:hypothetical protein